MSDDKNKPIHTREILNERDLRIFKMRQSGTSVVEIARRFNLSTSTVTRSIQRQLEKMNREAILAYPEVLRMELERLDNLQQAIWPLTQHRRQVLDDGTEVQLEPDLKAIQSVLSIMDRRSKLLGMEQTNVNVQVESNTTHNVRAIIASQPGVDKPGGGFDPESEAKKLLEIMAISGVLPDETIKVLLGSDRSEIIDAEIIEIEGGIEVNQDGVDEEYDDEDNPSED
ncbi:MAG: helix-turn-helix domain-containing protein [Bacteroidota bacterium]